MTVITKTAPEGVAGADLTARRSARFSSVRHGFTLAWRSSVKTRTQPQLILLGALQPMIMLLMFWVLFGGALAGDRDSYIQFLLPGILAQAPMFQVLSVGQGVYADVASGIFDRFRSLPIARSAPLTGYILGDLPRFMVASVLVVPLGMLLGFRFDTDFASLVTGFLLMLLLVFSISWISATLGLLAKSTEAVNLTSMLTLLPVVFGSNALVNTDTLPGWLQVWVDINPMTHLASALRALLTGEGSENLAGSISNLLVSCGVILVVFIPLAIRAYNRRSK